jgi:PIN domain nuclease of toxin-antitoxin system
MGRDAMNEMLVDTHVLIWMMEDNGKLSPSARQAIRVAAAEDCLLVSAITPWEIGLLAAKGRVRLYMDAQSWVDRALAMPGVRLVPLSAKIAIDSSFLPWESHPDPADRILVATARQLGATLITADERILLYGSQRRLKCLAAT